MKLAKVNCFLQNNVSSKSYRKSVAVMIILIVYASSYQKVEGQLFDPDGHDSGTKPEANYVFKSGCYRSLSLQQESSYFMANVAMDEHLSVCATACSAAHLSYAFNSVKLCFCKNSMKDHTYISNMSYCLESEKIYEKERVSYHYVIESKKATFIQANFTVEENKEYKLFDTISFASISDGPLIKFSGTNRADTYMDLRFIPGQKQNLYSFSSYMRLVAIGENVATSGSSYSKEYDQAIELFKINASDYYNGTFKLETKEIYNSRNVMASIEVIGSNIELDIDYGDGTNETIKVFDTPLISTGTPVPRFIMEPSINMEEKNSVASEPNMDVPSPRKVFSTIAKEFGYIRGIEFYAASSGTFTFNIATNELYCQKNNRFENCDNVNDLNIGPWELSIFNSDGFYYDILSKKGFSTKGIKTVQVEQGYNFIKDPFPGIMVNPGEFIQWNSDQEIAIYESETLLMKDMPNSKKKFNYYIRAFISTPIPTSIFHHYKLRGVYNMTVSNKKYGLKSMSQSFTVMNVIEEISIKTKGCPINKECLIEPVFSPSDYIGETSLVWGGSCKDEFGIEIEKVTGNTTTGNLTYIFKTKAKCYMTIELTTPTTFLKYAQKDDDYITIDVPLDSPHIVAYNKFSNESLSITGEAAIFLFTLKSGSNYKCLLNFGDGMGLMSISGDLDKMGFPRVFHKDGVYNVTIDCLNPLSKASYSMLHYSQTKISDLKLLTGRVKPNEQFKLEFSLKGASPEFQLTFDDEIYELTYNTETNTAETSNLPGQLEANFNITLMVKNKISSVRYSELFGVGGPMSGPYSKIAHVENNYKFKTSVSYLVGLSQGSNVLVEVFFGDEEDLEKPTSSIQMDGGWKGDLIVNHTHKTPGDFEVRFVLTNPYGRFELKEKVTIMTGTSKLIPMLKHSPVVYTPLGAIARFKFHYSEFSGSNALVKIWPGDKTNATLGPFKLGMDFRDNITKNAFSYKYSSADDFVVTFEVFNSIESVFYTLPITVTPGVYGLSLDVVPKFAKIGEEFSVSAFLMQGGPTTKYRWIFNSATIITNRSSTDLTVPDVKKFTAPLAINYTITVMAFDSVSRTIADFMLQVQEPVTSITTTDSSYLFSRPVDYDENYILVVSLSFSYEGNPTNPLYYVDYGDGSLINNAQMTPSRFITLNHNYKQSGIFNVKITLYNMISSTEKLIKVKVLNRFIDFKCELKFRPIPVDGTKEYSYPYQGESESYAISIDNDLRMHCKWKNTPIEKIEIFDKANNIMLEQYTNFSLLSEIETEAHEYGYIVPLSADIIKSLNGDTIPMSLVYSNSLFNGSFNFNIEPLGSVIFNKMSTKTETGKPGQTVQFTVSEALLGEPSCGQITTYVNNIEYSSKTIGSSRQICAGIFPGVSYEDTYKMNSNDWTFGVVMLDEEGFVTINATVANKFSTSSVVAGLPVAATPCFPPLVEIESKKDLFYEPKIYKRTDLFSIVTSVTPRCNTSLSNKKTWQLYKVDSQTGKPIELVSLENNPTVANSELVILDNSMDVGLYKFVFKITMKTTKSEFISLSSTFVQIEPTGIAVAAFKGGINEVRIGIKQRLRMDPVKFSKDYDGLIDMSSLVFKFYCKVEDNGISDGYPTKGVGVLKELSEFANEDLNYDTTCLGKTKEFELKDNVLKLEKGSLKYMELRVYKFLITTQLPGFSTLYSQEVNVIVENFLDMPSLELACVPPETCIQYNNFQIINPNSQIIIDGKCIEGCESAYEIRYNWQLFMSIKTGSKNVWMPCKMPSPIEAVDELNTTHISGSKRKKLALLPELFSSFSNVIHWKVQFEVSSVSTEAGVAVGISSVALAVNQLPYNGTCSVFPFNGISMETEFNITCSNWYDPDGEIVRYEYYAQLKNVELKIGLGFNKEGSVLFQMQQGPDYDDYRMVLSVKIIDSARGIHDYVIQTPITVKPNENFAQRIMQPDYNADFLFAGNTQTILKVATTVIQIMNTDAIHFSNSEANEIIVTNSTYNTTTAAPTTVAQVSNKYRTTVEERIRMRNIIFGKLGKASISDISSIKMWTAVLSGATEITGEISTGSAAIAIIACTNLVDSLDRMAGKTSLQDITQAAIGVASSVSNVVTGLSNALKEMTAANQSNSTSEESTERLRLLRTNLEESPGDEEVDQKTLLTESFNKANDMLKKLTGIMSSRLALDQTIAIKTNQVKMDVKKGSAADMKPNIAQGDAKIKVPNLCTMQGQPSGNTSALGVPSDDDCNTRTVVTQAKLGAVAPAGKSESSGSTDGSSTLGLSFSAEDNSDIAVDNSDEPIDLLIPRAADFKMPQFEFVAATNMTVDPLLPFFSTSFSVKQFMSAIFIQVKPENNTVGYLFWNNNKSRPHYDATTRNFIKVQSFCPSDLITQQNESFYQFFSNINETANFTGIYGYGLREMTSKEFEIYCPVNSTGNATIEIQPLINNNIVFEYDFSVRSFTANCMYYDQNSSEWRSDGVEMLPDTNHEFTHCVATHLTDFAGGLIVLPKPINFDDAFANADFLSNPTVYSTLMAVSAIFILLAIFAHHKDKQDSEKVGITPLVDNNPTHDYYYEIIVFTGNRENSETDSRVRFILSGDSNDSGIRRMYDPNRKAFRSGGVDSFIMSTDKPLDNLNYLRIWHDNSGRGGSASWYLRYIIVQDMQTKQKFYFLNEKWLAVEKDDGIIERLLPLSTNVQKTQLTRLIKKEAKEKFKDGHLWMSIFIRPKQSSFSRLNRTICAFVLLYMSMVVNIFYYDLQGEEPTPGSALKIGPLTITVQSIGIGIMSNLLVLPPTMILMTIFTKSKRRVSRLKSIQRRLEKNDKYLKKNNVKKGYNMNDTEIQNEMQIDKMEQNIDIEPDINDKKKKKKNKKPFLLPWWFKIIGYIFSFCIVGVSCFFIAIKGILLGDETVQKWLTSFVSSIFSSVFVTQPIKIIVVTSILVFLCRKSNDKNDNVEEGDDENEMIKSKKDLSKYDKLVNKPKITYSEMTGRLSPCEIAIARKKRVREVLFWKLVREFFGCAIFLGIIYQYSFSNMDFTHYGYQNSLRIHFDQNFGKIQTVQGFWTWIQDDFVPKFSVKQYYNNHSAEMGQFGVNDYVSNIIGYAQLRQNRAKEDSCKLFSSMTKSINYCVGEYSKLGEEKGNFMYNWTTYDPAYTPSVNMTHVYGAYRYRSSDELDSLPYNGKYAVYNGGGYVFDMIGDVDSIVNGIEQLKKSNWIDKRSRSLIIEFTLYNPNVNLFAVVTLAVEILATGNLLNTLTIDVMDVFGANSAIKNGIYYAYFGLVLWSAFREMKKFYRLRKKYFFELWSLVQVLIIVFSLTAFAIWTYRTRFGDKLMKLFSETKGKGYVSFRYLNSWNLLLTMLLAFSPALATLKFIKLLRYNKTIRLLTIAIKMCMKSLFGVIFIFLVVFFTFVQTFYLLLNTHVPSFNKIISATATCFLLLLGKFDVGSIIESDPFLGGLLFVTFNIAVLMIVLNLIITTISDTFSEIKRDSPKYLDGYEMGEYIMEKLGHVYSDYRKGQLLRKPIYEEEDVKNPEFYITHNAESLRLNTEKLVNHLEEYIDSHEKVIEMEFKDEDTVSLSDVKPKRKFRLRKNKMDKKN